MKLKNCKSCGKLHIESSEFCKKCYKTENDIYIKIRNYLYNNPNSSVEQVHEGTGIKANKIRKFVLEGRFITVKVKED